MHFPQRHNTERGGHRQVAAAQSVPRRNSVAVSESAESWRRPLAQGRGLDRVRNSVDLRRLSNGRGAFDAEIVYGGSTFSLPPQMNMESETELPRRCAQVMLTITAQ